MPEPWIIYEFVSTWYHEDVFGVILDGCRKSRVAHTGRYRHTEGVAFLLVGAQILVLLRQGGEVVRSRELGRLLRSVYFRAGLGGGGGGFGIIGAPCVVKFLLWDGGRTGGVGGGVGVGLLIVLVVHGLIP